MQTRLRELTATLILVPLVLSSAGVFGQGPAVRRSPVPSASDQEAASAAARTSFKNDYTKAETAVQKSVLAKKLLEQADAAKGNPASHFVLLRLARDIAAQAGDVETAVLAIDAMAAAFEVDTVKIRAETLAKVTDNPRPAATAPKVKEIAGSSAEQPLPDERVSRDGSAPQSLQKVLANSLGMRFVWIQAGEFLMGSTPEEIVQAVEDAKTWRLSKSLIPNESPRHRVRISKPFYLGVYEVTQAEYEQVMNMTDDVPSADKDTSGHPVRMISWRDATQFCQKLSARPKEKMAHRVYRLPTEAEWEYACRAGTTTKWSFGNDPALTGDYAWFAKNSQGRTHPVGQKKPNAWGLYDMYGSVWEWCSDWFGKDYYRQSPASDPTGPSDGSLRVMRGGASNVAHPGMFRSAFRDTPMPQATTNPSIGLRVAMQIGKGSKP